METGIIAILGMIAGAAAVWLALRPRITAAASQEKNAREAAEVREQASREALERAAESEKTLRTDYETRLSELRENLSAAREETAGVRREANEAVERMHAAETRAGVAEQRLEAQERHFQETLARVTLEMKEATEKMLKERQEEFSVSSTTRLGEIVNPLKETIDRMKQAMTDNTLRHTEMGFTMKSAMESMIKASEKARASADELADVLRHRNRAQGEWGETVLQELLDSQGLTCGIHYDTQSTLRDAAGNAVRSESGATLRPDVILHLDRAREVIVDSKVSLSSYFDFLQAETEAARDIALKSHIDSIWRHVKELAAKDYSSYILPPKVKMDYVIMFVPHSGALWAALNARPDLWRKAMEMNVYIADEQTLFAALRIINMTWIQIAQAENHELVYRYADEILDRTGQFMKRYQSIGKAIDEARKSWEEGEKKLQPGGQSILQTCAKLQKLGARQNPRNPIPLENANIPDEEMPPLPEA